MSIKAYQNVQNKVTDPRRIEIMVFEKCNALLRAAAIARSSAAAGDPLAAAKSEAEALFENSRLWIHLIGDLAGDDNQLPDALRAQLISLGLWANHYADAVRSAKASFDPLIDLNTQMIVGLTASLESGVGPSTGASTAIDPAAPIVT